MTHATPTRTAQAPVAPRHEAHEVCHRGRLRCGRQYMAVFGLAYAALKSIMTIDAAHLSANMVGVIVSIATNFLINDGWTWGDRHKGDRAQWRRRLVRYYISCSIAALIQLAVAKVVFATLLDRSLIVAGRRDRSSTLRVRGGSPVASP